MPSISVDGAEIHVEEIGSGQVALVLHGGLGVDHHMYRSLDPLAERLHLVYVDHRANGGSTGDVATATMQQWAADAAEVARQVGGGEPVIVIGHSYGGFIAQEMMISHPDVVRAAILVTTTPGQLGTGEEPAPEGPPVGARSTGSTRCSCRCWCSPAATTRSVRGPSPTASPAGCPTPTR